MILDLGVRHDTQSGKQSDMITNCETVLSSDITLISHSYQPIKFQDQKELL